MEPTQNPDAGGSKKVVLELTEEQRKLLVEVFGEELVNSLKGVHVELVNNELKVGSQRN